MARPRKPTAIKKLQGTLQKCRTNQDEPKAQGDLKKVLPPAYLAADEKAIWQYALEQVPDDMLSTMDFAIFLQWVTLHYQLIRIQQKLTEEGMFLLDHNGISFEHPLLKLQIKLQQNLIRVCTELGFTPASRSKVQVKKDTKEPDNPFITL